MSQLFEMATKICLFKKLLFTIENTTALLFTMENATTAGSSQKDTVFSKNNKRLVVKKILQKRW